MVLMKFCIAWVNFIDYRLQQEVVEVYTEGQALRIAFERLTDTEYDAADYDSASIKQAAFDNDGMISALEI
jgi:hypothetical protein